MPQRSLDTQGGIPEMARSFKQLEARLRALEEWRESVEGESTTVIGFQLDHEYEDPEIPETWVE